MKSVLNSPRLLELKKKKNQILKRKILFSLLILIFILISLSFLFRWEKININNIQISGNKVLETKMIEEVIKENISGNYLWVFPKTNFLFYPKENIEKQLTFKFKRIKDISLNIKNTNTLNISLSERVASYTYCGIISIEENKCYFMDESGYIFDEAPYFSGNIYLKFYSTATMNGNLFGERGDPSGSYFFESNFKKLISFKESFEKIGVKPVGFYVQENGDIEMFLLSKGVLETQPKIIFKIDGDINQLIENLQSVLTTEPLQSDFKNKYSSLLYIDLRFGNKVYYKFK